MAGRGGQPGNTNATKTKVWLQALERAARPKDLQEIAEMVVQQAKEGQQWAVQELANRLDGKPVQPLEHSGEFTQRLATEYSNAELALIAAGKEPGASADPVTQH